MKRLDERTRNQIEEWISELTLQEKIWMIHGDNIYDTKGIERLGIPPLRFSDGPMGVRADFMRGTIGQENHGKDLVTKFPCNISVAASWNTDIAFEYGNSLGLEVRGRGKDVSLSPGINIHRTPLNGRTFEYLSEDPYLNSKLAVQVINGLQENDIGACAKHFVANNQETNRTQVDVQMDNRTFNEIYLPAFKAAITEGKPLVVMGAYNKFRGDFCCENKYLLTELLRDQWGFDGIVVSDWDAIHDTNKAIEAGTDVDMRVDPAYDDYPFANPLKAKIESGEIPMEELDKRVRRILELMFKLNMFNPEERKRGAFNTPNSAATALKVAQEAMVLLKNDRHILPLSKNAKKIAVIGENANRSHLMGGGSSDVQALYEVFPILGICMHLGGNVEVQYAQGYSSEETDPLKQQAMADEAFELAKNSETVIYIGGLQLRHDEKPELCFDSESTDRVDLKLPFGQDNLIKRLLEANNNTVIVNISGSPVEMSEWIKDAHAVIQQWYSGSESGNALASVLFGDVNPSGKLPITFPKKIEDTPAHVFGEFPGTDRVTYNEGIFVGYRYYDTYEVDPLFCFGHGLSYTTFAYKDMNVRIVEDKAEVDFTIENTGLRAGAEVSQLYVTDLESSVKRPQKELKGFVKTYLDAGESKKNTLILKREDFCFFSEEQNDWVFENGEFELLIGSSSRDIRLKTIMECR